MSHNFNYLYFGVICKPIKRFSNIKDNYKLINSQFKKRSILSASNKLNLKKISSVPIKDLGNKRLLDEFEKVNRPIFDFELEYPLFFRVVGNFSMIHPLKLNLKDPVFRLFLQKLKRIVLPNLCTISLVLFRYFMLHISQEANLFQFIEFVTLLIPLNKNTSQFLFFLTGSAGPARKTQKGSSVAGLRFSLFGTQSHNFKCSEEHSSGKTRKETRRTSYLLQKNQ